MMNIILAQKRVIEIRQTGYYKDRQDSENNSTAKLSVMSENSLKDALTQTTKPVSAVHLSSSRTSGTSFVSSCSKGSSVPSKIPRAVKSTSKQSFSNTRMPSFIEATVLTVPDNSSLANETITNDKSMNDLEFQYNLKLKQLVHMKKTLLEKQKPVIDFYKNIIIMRDKVLKVEGKELPIEELKIIDYQLEDYQVCSGGDSQDVSGVDEEKIKTLMLKIQNIANGFTNICYKIINQKYNLYDKLVLDAEANPTEVKQQIFQCKKELKDLEVNVKLQLETEENNIWGYLKELKAIITSGYPDNIELLKQNLILQEAEIKLSETLEELVKEKDQRIKEQQQYNSQEDEILRLSEINKELRKELDDEKINSEQQKERESVTEKKLNIMKNELRAIKLQKQGCELKLQELKKSEAMDNEKKGKKKENKVAELKEQLEDSDFQLEEMSGQKVELEEKYNKLKSEMDEYTADMTKKKMILQTKLQTAESSLREAEDEVAVYKVEKYELTQTLNKYNDENKNIHTELETKNALIAKLGLQNKELREHSLPREQEKVTSNENLRNDSNITVDDVLRYHDMNKEIVYLRAKLEAEVERNNELSQKLLKLEHKQGVNKQLAHEHENLMTARDNILEMIYERKVLISSENEKLESHVNLLREQINMLSQKYKKKQFEIIKLQKALNQKNHVIEICEQKIDMLVDNHKMLSDRSVHLQSKLNNVEQNFVPIMPAYVDESEWPVSILVDSNTSYEICEE